MSSEQVNVYKTEPDKNLENNSLKATNTPFEAILFVRPGMKFSIIGTQNSQALILILCINFVRQILSCTILNKEQFKNLNIFLLLTGLQLNHIKRLELSPLPVQAKSAIFPERTDLMRIHGVVRGMPGRNMLCS